jgi:hypothetical protein
VDVNCAMIYSLLLVLVLLSHGAWKARLIAAVKCCSHAACHYERILFPCIAVMYYVMAPAALAWQVACGCIITHGGTQTSFTSTSSAWAVHLQQCTSCDMHCLATTHLAVVLAADSHLFKS